METKNRIVKTTEENCHNTLEERLVEQDKISFKAGMEEEASGGHNSISFLEGYQEGEKLGKAEEREKVLDEIQAGVVSVAGLIEKARQEVAREIFEKIEKKWGYFTEKLEKVIVDDGGYYGQANSMKDWQSLKDRFLKEEK